MANSQAMCTSFKVEVLNGIHALGTSVTRASTAADIFKVALYLTTATISASTTVYNASGEVSGTNYSAGGNTLVWNAPGSTGTTAFTTPNAAFSWSTVTLSTAFDCAFIYNSTQGNKAVSAHTFGSTTITAGNFTLTMPANDASNALIRFA